MEFIFRVNYFFSIFIMNLEDELRVRNKLWSSDVEKLLRKWRSQVQKRKIVHMKSAEYFKKKHYAYGLPASVLGALATTGAFATFRNCDPETSECEGEQWVRLLVGFVSMAQSGLSAFNLFMNYQSRSEKHLSAAEGYESLFRAIDTILQMPPSTRGDPIGTLREIQNHYDEISRIATISSDAAETELKYSVYKGGSSGSSNSSSPRELAMLHKTKSKQPSPLPVRKNKSDEIQRNYNSDPSPSLARRVKTAPFATVTTPPPPPLEIAHQTETEYTDDADISIHINEMNDDCDTEDSEAEVTIRYDLEAAAPSHRRRSISNLTLSSLLTKKFVDASSSGSIKREMKQLKKSNSKEDMKE